ncbi:APC family permease [Hyphococcus sp.]|uniref:APC family permease n=1 Tax=Hyphococcus sp. TaxID=2038636 RepID=UPI002084F7DF|nr:MAG: amino acid permease [Marinicaulis sp.]
MTGNTELTRTTGRLGTGVIALNGIIGSGIFALPAVAMQQAGYFSPWVFLIAALLITTIALSFARAASFFRETGGPIVYTTHSFGRFVGFQTGWLLYISRVAGLAASTNLLVSYASWFVPALDTSLIRPMAVAALISFYTWVNYVGVRNSMTMLYILTALKLAPLFLLVLFGLPSTELNLIFGADVPEFRALGEAILILMYAFIGFEVAVINAGESKNPKADIPAALVTTVAQVSVFYIAIQIVSISVDPGIAETNTPLARVAELLLGPIGASILAMGAVFSIAGSSATSMLVGPRLTFALSKQEAIPRWFAAVHPKFGTPGNSILFCGGIGILLGVSGGFVWLATVSTLVRFITYALTIAALPRIEKTMDQDPKQFTIPGGLTVPVFAFLLSIWLVGHASLKAWGAAAFLSLIGSAFYFFTHRRFFSKAVKPKQR